MIQLVQNLRLTQVVIQHARESVYNYCNNCRHYVNDCKWLQKSSNKKLLRKTQSYTTDEEMIDQGTVYVKWQMCFMFYGDYLTCEYISLVNIMLCAICFRGKVESRRSFGDTATTSPTQYKPWFVMAAWPLTPQCPIQAAVDWHELGNSLAYCRSTWICCC